MKRAAIQGVLLLVFIGGAVAVAGSDWLHDVPAREQQKTNPFRDQPQAIQAGRLLFEDHCVQCHGAEAQGKNKRPALRSPRIQSATDGSLHWFLFNGSVRRGMPSWSKLPDQQLWQLVSYLKSLKSSD